MPQKEGPSVNPEDLSIKNEVDPLQAAGLDAVKAADPSAAKDQSPVDVVNPELRDETASLTSLDDPGAAEQAQVAPPEFVAASLPATRSEFALKPSFADEIPDPFAEELGLLPGNPLTDLESDAEMKHETVMRMIGENMNSISSGDDLHIPVKPKKTIEEELIDLGFPPRPHLWPPMMSWPQLRDMEVLRQKVLTAEILQEYLKAQELRQSKMLDRASTIDDWIRTHNRKQGMFLTPFINTRRSQPYRGVNWACLLDEDMAQNQVLSRVYSWGHMRARTADGGVVRAFQSHIKVDVSSAEAVRIAIMEARARGWKTLRIAGDHEFTRQAIEICRQANIAAEITVRATPLSPYRKRYHMTPSLPGPSEQESPEQQKDEFAALGHYGKAAPKMIPRQATLKELGDEESSTRKAIPDHGIASMPKSPFPSSLAREGGNEEDLLEELELVGKPAAAAGDKISDRLAFGAPLDGESISTAGARKKTEEPTLDAISPES